MPGKTSARTEAELQQATSQQAHNSMRKTLPRLQVELFSPGGSKCSTWHSKWEPIYLRAEAAPDESGGKGNIVPQNISSFCLIPPSVRHQSHPPSHQKEVDKILV